MSERITIWRRFDQDTTPRGFGNLPTYHIDKPATSDKDMVWAEPVDITIPDGYKVDKSNFGVSLLYGPDGTHFHISDNGEGHPAIILSRINGKTIYEILDQQDINDPSLGSPPVIGQLTFRHGYADEPVSYTDPADLLKDLKEALDTRGPNGVSVNLMTSDTELHYEVYALEAGEYGYTVDKEKYLALAQEFGLKAPELEKAVVDDLQMDMTNEEDDLGSLALQMEQANTEEGPTIGKIILHSIDKEIAYASADRLQQDYLNIISKFGAGVISATLMIEDHELSFTLDEAEAKCLGFTMHKDKYMELMAIYGQGAQELTQAAVEDEWDGPKWGQEAGELEL